MSTTRKLTLDDIADVRAYERERATFRAEVIELKQRRRVAIGTLLTILFENRETIRFQIQEMARVEHLTTDAAIQDEIDTYNSMIPEPGQLCATLFIELTSDEQVREWLPKLVGIERSLVLTVDPSQRPPDPAEHDAHHARWVATPLTRLLGLARADGSLIDHPAVLALG